MWKAGVGMAGAAASLGAWAFWVSRERSRVPKGRRQYFAPGSADELAAQNIQSGDLLLFSRDCSLYYVGDLGYILIENRQKTIKYLFVQPCGAAMCALTKSQAGGGMYDHVAMAVHSRTGELHVVEEGFGSITVRKFDPRILYSRAFEIVVRPLAVPLSPEEELGLWKRVEELRGQPSRRLEPLSVMHLDQSPVLLVSELYASINRPSPATLLDVLDANCPIFRESYWFRDRRQ